MLRTPGKPPGSRSGQRGKAKNEQMLFALPPESEPSVCAFMSTRSKASADAQLHEVALEIVEIERARGSGHRAPDLNVPRRRDKVSFAEGRVESRARIVRRRARRPRSMSARTLAMSRGMFWKATSLHSKRRYLAADRQASCTAPWSSQ
jgi:hypothetical protein